MDDAETYTFLDRHLGRIEITGTRIGYIDTRTGAPEQRLGRRRPRWGVNSVFKLRNGEYVLVKEAFSILYHLPDTECRTSTGMKSGDKTTVSVMAGELAALGTDLSEAISCDVCKPDWPEDLAPGDEIRYEFPRRTIDRCDTGAQVTHQLVNSRRHSGSRSTQVPEPTRALLEQCRVADPGFFTDDQPAVQIG